MTTPRVKLPEVAEDGEVVDEVEVVEVVVVVGDDDDNTDAESSSCLRVHSIIW
jgi:hypothetical protein